MKQESTEYLNDCSNRRIKAKLKGLPPAIHRQQALPVAQTIYVEFLSNFSGALHYPQPMHDKLLFLSTDVQVVINLPRFSVLNNNVVHQVNAAAIFYNIIKKPGRLHCNHQSSKLHLIQ